MTGKEDNHSHPESAGGGEPAAGPAGPGPERRTIPLEEDGDATWIREDFADATELPDERWGGATAPEGNEAATPRAVRPLNPGDLFLGKYEIESFVGSGGMGSVLLARHRDLGVHYAIKVLHASVPDRAAVDRFKREAKASAMVEHPNAVRVFDFGEHDGHCYIVMEYLRGESLAAKLGRVGRLPVEEAVRLAGVVCDVLSIMHEKRIVHRDLKPDNIFLQQQGGTETVKILDFGIAKLASATIERNLTRAGTVVGTPAYMSPEQCQSEPVDGRSDIYSLGVVLFQMLTGRLPFDSDNVLTMMYQHVNQEPPVAHEVEPLVPPAVSDVVRRMLAKDPADRFQSAWDCARSLSEASGVSIPLGEPPAASAGADRPATARTIRREGVRHSSPRTSGRRARVAAAVAGTLVVGLAGAGALYLRHEREAAPTAAPTPAPPVASALGDRFAFVSGGEVTIGSDTGDCAGLEDCAISDDEIPAHALTLAPYYIARYEVTNAEYAEFVRATGRASPKGWRDSYARGADRVPVTNVSWNDAVAYAEWLSARDGVAYRLPTEAEWEYAARGPERRLFPWGDYWSASRVHANLSLREGSPLPVDEAPNNAGDVSPFGVFALAGNVSEWTSSPFELYPGSPHKPTQRDLASKIIRGGSFHLRPNSSRAAFRFWELPGFTAIDLGLRLAADPAAGGSNAR